MRHETTKKRLHGVAFFMALIARQLLEYPNCERDKDQEQTEGIGTSALFICE